MTKSYDALIIDAGQAGPPLAGRLSDAGMSVALVERKFFGGTCVNVGCMPTKTLVASAYAIHLARRGQDFGMVLNGSVGVDMKRVHARQDEVVQRARHGVEAWLAGMKNCTVYRGHAQFLSDREVTVEGEVLSAKRIFINAGGRASIPDLPGLATVPYLTNTSMMALDTLPRHLVIIGGSYIGLEFAQMFRRFGSEVTVIETGSRLIHREDPEISDMIQDILESEGIAINLNATSLSVEPAGDDIGVHLTGGAGSMEIVGSHLLIATGRKPNTDDLSLENTGVAIGKGGYITVDDQLQTSVSTIWALGDCNGKGAFTHTAYNDFEIVAANLLDNDPRRVSDRITAYALYIDPPLGRVGMTETEVRASGKPALIGTRPMNRVGRAIEKGETQGAMKILVDAESRQILGASILGTGGDEAIHGILDIMYAKAPCDVLQRAVHIHPTVSELIPTVLGSQTPLG